MIAMVSGGVSFAPRPEDGIVWFFEPLRTLASFIVSFQEGTGATALKSSLYAFALLLLVGALVLSVCGYLIKLPMRKYQVKG
jgi:ABC-type phosphate transport system permease subunit